MLLRSENVMFDFGLSEALIVLFIAIVFGLGIFTLRKFLKNKDF